jgi:lipopolysaccharide/colanic/teichoic acid biosynthesis glycosyltransferase
MHLSKLLDHPRRVGHSHAQANGAVQKEEAWRFTSKAVLDLGLIVLTFPVWLPLMLFVTLWIKGASRGPAFFRQRRVGYQGREFFIFKFRTMKVNADTRCHENYFERLVATDCPMTKLDESGDPRLIPGGALLRASGLDELPQIFNVLQGDMSLVGPRPCTVPELERYEPWQKERFETLPGLTGFWQTHGKNSTTFSEMITMDLNYVRNRSVALDLSIIARTIPVLLGQVFAAKRPTTARTRLNEALVVPAKSRLR